MPQISVIIPVHNTRPYLEKCLSSVLGQTFADWELICVDTASEDGSLDVLRRFAAKDNRIRVFSVPNEGPGIARNKGLDEACGKYVLFLDSDDFLDSRACETLRQAAEKQALDLVSCDFYIYQDKTGHFSPRSRALELAFKKDLDADEGDGRDEFVKFAFSLPFVWGKLIRREIIEKAGLRFPPGAAEDVPFCVSCLSLCRRVKMLDGQYLFYYRVGRGGNISGRGEKMLLDGIINFSVLENNLRKYGVFEEVKETFWFNKMVLLIGDERLFAGRMGNVSRDTVQKAYDLVRGDVNSLDLALFKNRNFFFRWKVRRFKKALQNNDLSFPRRLRKLRNLLMPVLDPWFKLTNKK